MVGLGVGGFVFLFVGGFVGLFVGFAVGYMVGEVVVGSSVGAFEPEALVIGCTVGK
jgi:hypothetical protein